VPSRLVGLVEGFYGAPWTWDRRLEVAAWCADRGLTDYVYAPKDDPKHRMRWREPYDRAEMAGFERFAEGGRLRLGFAISPGLSIDYDDADDRAVLARKVDQVVDIGARVVLLAFDDIPFGGADQGHAQARLTTWLGDHLDDRAELVLGPTEYVGMEPSGYLDALATGIPEAVLIFWTGATVVNDAITTEQARRRRAALGGRPPLLWDNVPVNDAVMVDRLHLGPLVGREPGVLDECAGYLANPMVQARASKLPLASIAAWIRGDDAEAVWRATAAELGWSSLAEACDTDVASVAVAHAIAGNTEPARVLFTEAASCTAPGLEDEADPWLTQVRRDARLALQALDVLDGDHGVEHALAMASRWRRSRTSTVTVFGPRCSVRISIGQADDGTWRVEPGLVQRDANAIDDLVEAALDVLEGQGSRAARKN
jgi:hypothetical protein